MRVTPLRRKTRFQPLVRRYWTGFYPQGPNERFPRCNRYISSSFPKLCLAQSHRPLHPPACAVPRHQRLLPEQFGFLTSCGLAAPTGHSPADARRGPRCHRSITLSSLVPEPFLSRSDYVASHGCRCGTEKGAKRGNVRPSLLSSGDRPKQSTPRTASRQSHGREASRIMDLGRSPTKAGPKCWFRLRGKHPFPASDTAVGTTGRGQRGPNLMRCLAVLK